LIPEKKKRKKKRISMKNGELQEKEERTHGLMIAWL
jgi:hypothetical protein